MRWPNWFPGTGSREDRESTLQTIEIWNDDLGLDLTARQKAAWSRRGLEASARECRASRQFQAVMTAEGVDGMRLLPFPRSFRQQPDLQLIDPQADLPPWQWLAMRPPPELERGWHDRVMHVRRQKPDVRVAVAALLRDSGATIPFWRSKLRRWLEGWAEASVHILENDSADDTHALLRDWQREDPRLVLLGKDDIPGASRAILDDPVRDKTATVGRITRMAVLRNTVLDSIRRQPVQPDFICWIDMDRVGILSEQGWLHGLSFALLDPELDAIFPQGLSSNLRYYDTLALVFPREPHIVHEETCQLIMPYKATAARWLPRDGDRPIRIKSAFGGMGWYRWSSAREHVYAAHVDGRRSCEHSFMNLNLRVGIDPWWLTIGD